MENDIRKAYSEVDKILSFMDKKYVDKIPEKMRKLIKNEKLKDYEPDIKPDKSLNEQNLQRKTLAILAMLDLNYWCESEEEKQKLIQEYAENDKKKEQELREKYNPDNLFKNKIETENVGTELVEYKEKNFIQKIMEKIKSFFKSRY